MRKKPAICDCGSPAYRKKNREWICLKCDQMEHEATHWSNPNSHSDGNIKRHLAKRKYETTAIN